MSGLYIPGMGMPTGNPEEPTAIWIYPDGSVKAFYNRGKQILNTRAVHVPDHGGLIDADEMAESIMLFRQLIGLLSRGTGGKNERYLYKRHRDA